MLTLAQLMRLTPREVRHRSVPTITNIQRATIELGAKAGDVDAVKKVISTVVANDGPRLTQIHFHGWERDAGSRNLPVWVHCQCPYFLYYCEVACTYQGSSSIINSNGAYPRIRNPKMVPYLCKHLYAAARTAPTVEAKDLRKKTRLSDADINEVMDMIGDLIPSTRKR